MASLLAHIELGDHRQIDKGEGHQGTKVDQGQGDIQIEGDRRQRHATHQHHVDRRRAPARMDIAEEALRQHGIAAHHIEQT